MSVETETVDEGKDSEGRKAAYRPDQDSRGRSRQDPADAGSPAMSALEKHRGCSFTFDLVAWRWKCVKHNEYVSKALVNQICQPRRRALERSLTLEEPREPEARGAPDDKAQDESGVGQVQDLPLARERHSPQHEGHEGRGLTVREKGVQEP